MRFFLDVPPYALGNYCFNAVSQLPSYAPVSGWKRIVFVVEVPDTICREADVELPADCATVVAEVPCGNS